MIMKVKFCWLAKQYRKGWRLGFCLGNQDTRYIPNLLLKQEQDVKKVINGNIVYVHMKGGKQ